MNKNILIKQYLMYVLFDFTLGDELCLTGNK